MQWLLAEAYRQYNDYAHAEELYEEVYRREKGRVYPMSAFWLATMMKNNGNYANSLKLWKKVNRKFKRDKKGYVYLKSKQEIESCSWAREHLFDSVPVPMTNVGQPVNSYISEFAPFLVDSTTLLFASLRANKYGEDREVYDAGYRVKIYQSKWEADQWGTPEALDSTVNKNGLHQANGAFNGDRSRFYFSRCDAAFQCVIMMQRRTANGGWSAATEVSGVNHTSASTTQPHLAEIDGTEYLFFASDRPGGKGGLDIWYTSSSGDDQWDTPRNAGDSINTPDNEITPWYDASSETFYFSSQWHNGFGGFDVFSSNGKPGNLRAPNNMGYPFNTPANDYYFIYNDTTGAGFLASNRIGSLHKKAPTCCNDLWFFELPPAVHADTLPFASLEELNQSLPVTLYFHNDEPNPRTTDSTTRRNYLDTYEEYRVMEDEYVTKFSAGLSGAQKDTAAAQMERLFNDRIRQGVDDLSVFSALLQRELDKGYNIEITIQGYASPLAKTQYNRMLTGRRISSLQNYLHDYQGGVLRKYIDQTAKNGGTLSFVRVPFGEYTANKQITDNPNADDAIFSVGAALERKIEIVSVQQAKRDSLYAEMKFNSEIHDFGSISKGDTVSGYFLLTNAGNMELRIDSIATDCNCVTLTPSNNSIRAGGRVGLEIQYRSANDEGLTARYITIFTNATPPEKRLTITAEVE